MNYPKFLLPKQHLKVTFRVNYYDFAAFLFLRARLQKIFQVHREFRPLGLPVFAVAIACAATVHAHVRTGLDGNTLPWLANWSVMQLVVVVHVHVCCYAMYAGAWRAIIGLSTDMTLTQIERK